MKLQTLLNFANKLFYLGAAKSLFLGGVKTLSSKSNYGILTEIHSPMQAFNSEKRQRIQRCLTVVAVRTTDVPIVSTRTVLSGRIYLRAVCCTQAGHVAENNNV